MEKDAREALTQIYRSAVAAADPYLAVKSAIMLEPGTLLLGGARYPLADIEKIHVIGAGKAVYGMARAAEETLGGLITGGAVVTKDGHGGELSRIGLYEASHPFPDGRGVLAASRIMDIAAGAGEDDLILCLLSGGASALMTLPAQGVTLKDKQEVTRLLLNSGADIGEVNCVRKHLSAIKGGRLAEAAYPAMVSSLIISDVVGDDLGVIASGPTAPDETTYIQAVEILKMRGVWANAPEGVRAHLASGAAGGLTETPKPGSEIFRRVDNVPVAFNMAALRKAGEVAGYLGFNTHILDGAVQGEASAFAAELARGVLSPGYEKWERPLCLIVGGETTVTVRGKGMGGRNQETALAFALGIQGVDNVLALFAGTDGTDGPTDAAGAFVDGQTVARAASIGLNAAAFLDDNDSYNFFKALGDLFITGPTGTNVMDIGVVLVY
jgi:glycerate 2-kinase